jgi:thioredoxin reductase
MAAAAELISLGQRVTLLESRDRLGGQMSLTLEAPGTAETARILIGDLAHRMGDAEVRLGFGGGTEEIAAAASGIGAGKVIVATGSRPYETDLELTGVEVVQSQTFLARDDHTVAGRTVIYDWGGDSSGMDAAELAAAAGGRVTLVSSSIALGEEVQEYRRNLYLERLYAAGVELLQHLELSGAADGGVRFTNIFDPGTTRTLEADLLVLAMGRVPVDEPAPALTRAGLTVFEAGDCRSPRTLEEAIFEGTLAARQAVGLETLGYDLELEGAIA